MATGGRTTHAYARRCSADYASRMVSHGDFIARSMRPPTPEETERMLAELRDAGDDFREEVAAIALALKAAERKRAVKICEAAAKGISHEVIAREVGSIGRSRVGQIVKAEGVELDDASPPSARGLGARIGIAKRP